jgi:hypothetical protein
MADVLLRPVLAAASKIAAALRSAGRIIAGLLRELSDESAYARHLAAHGRAHSPAEWRRFHERRLGAKYHRAKCC